MLYRRIQSVPFAVRRTVKGSSHDILRNHALSNGEASPVGQDDRARLGSCRD
jgi:hypothetical protein